MPRPQWNLDALKRVIGHHWGFQTLRPLQEQAMRAVLDGRDSLVVMPTGGGKSLCYQAPAVLRGGRGRAEGAGPARGGGVACALAKWEGGCR